MPEKKVVSLDNEVNDVSTELPQIQPSADPFVDLPIGLFDPDSARTLMRAQVRELTGADEEYLARASRGGTAKLLSALVERGLVDIDGIKVHPGVLESMTLVDREAILLGIRFATYGTELTLVDVKCDSCGKVSDVILELEKDIPVVERPDAQATFDVKLRKGGIAKVRLPNCGDMTAAMGDVIKDADRSMAEIKTILLDRCVLSADGLPPNHLGRLLGIADRDAVFTAITENSPGPRLEETSFNCLSCSEKISTPLNVQTLFRGL